MLRPFNFSKMMISVLIVGTDYAGAKTERNCLVNIGIQDIRVCKTGQEAVQEMNMRCPDLIFFNDCLEDMPGKTFIKLLALHPDFSRVPAVMILRQRGENEFKSLAVSACLTRPYSHQSLIDAVGVAFKHKSGPMPESSLDAFEHALNEAVCKRPEKPNPALLEEDAYKKAKAVLGRARSAMAHKQLDLALKYLKESVWPDKRLHAEATMDLARVWKAKGHPERHQHYLQQAGKHFAVLNDVEQADNIFTELRSLNPAARDPYQVLAGSLLKEYDYDGAARAYLRSLWLDPRKEFLLQGIASDCMFTDEPLTSAQKLSAFMDRKSGFFKEKELVQIVAAIIGDNKQVGVGGSNMPKPALASA